MTANPNAHLQATIPGRKCTWRPVVALFVLLVLAAVIRWPMLSHADRHMDSDLAVDGLTLREFVQTGHWPWHYPGTPHIGSLPLLLSLPAVPVYGTGPESLVFAGLLANLLLIAGVFLLAGRQFGHPSGFFACLILAAGGMGQVWLSARVTGGHLLAAAWFTWAWVVWQRLVTSPKTLPWFAFGLFCAIGLWTDSLFALGLPGLGLASLVASWTCRNAVPLKRRAIQAACFLVVLPIGPAMSRLGDGYNAYGSQFETTHDRAVLNQHARLLGLECFPRLVLGRTLKSGSPEIQMTHLKTADWLVPNLAGVFVAVCCVTIAGCFILKLAGMTRNINAQSTLTPEQSIAIWSGLILTLILSSSAFVWNKNIFNADNYRYLVLLLPLLGLFYGYLASVGQFVQVRRLLLVGLAVALSVDVLQWQKANGFRGQNAVAMQHSVLEMLKSADAPPQLDDTFEADYWEVYRGLYLADKPLNMARPFGFFPNRFPNDALESPRLLVISRSPTSLQMLQQAKAQGARLKFSGNGMEIYERQ